MTSYTYFMNWNWKISLQKISWSLMIISLMLESGARLWQKSSMNLTRSTHMTRRLIRQLMSTIESKVINTICCLFQEHLRTPCTICKFFFKLCCSNEKDPYIFLNKNKSFFMIFSYKWHPQWTFGDTTIDLDIKFVRMFLNACAKAYLELFKNYLPKYTKGPTLIQRCVEGEKSTNQILRGTNIREIVTS